MNAKNVLILLLAGAVLAVAGVFWYRHTTRLEAETRRADSVTTFSNQWTEAASEVKVQKEERTRIEQEITKWTREALSLSNDLSVTSSALEKSQAELKAVSSAAETAQAAAKTALLERDGKIRNLEGQRDTLTGEASALKQNISKLESNLAELNRKLVTSEGDREFLIAEMKRMQSDKAEWERKFHDLEALREQVRLVRGEEVLARRKDWMERGVYNSNLKGGQLLQRGFNSNRTREAGPAGVAAPGSDLNVEVSRDGAVRMGTNAPAAPR